MKRGVLQIACFISLTASGMAAAGKDSLAAHRQFFEKAACVDCHDAETKKGGLDLTAFPWEAANPANQERWLKLFDRVDRGEMPPPAKPKPDAALQQQFLSRLEADLTSLDKARQAESGRVPLRRLNRTEWAHTVQDLLQTDVPLLRMLPEEPSTGGFETVAEGLRFSSLQVEKWLEAGNVALRAIFTASEPPPSEKRIYGLKDEKSIAENLATPHGGPSKKNDEKSHHLLFRELTENAAEGTNPDQKAEVAFFSDTWQLAMGSTRTKHPGRYRVRIAARAIQTEELLTLDLYANNHRERRYLGTWTIGPMGRTVETVQRLEEGEFLHLQPQDLHKAVWGKGIWEVGATAYQGAGMAVSSLEIEGPLLAGNPDDPVPPGLRSLCEPEIAVSLRTEPVKKRPWRDGIRSDYLFTPKEDPATALRSVLTRFTAQALRRPAEPEDAAPAVATALQALEAGQPLEEALVAGAACVLSSGPFLLFSETPGPLDAWALAARLSYFLWSTSPDAELRRLAADGSLGQPTTLRAQALRMLADPKAERFISHFTSQWLGLANLDATTPDMKLYPEYDAVLRRSMEEETIAFFREVLQNDLPVGNFIHSDFVMANRRLAQHYGLTSALPTLDETLRRVPLPPDSPRGGLLGQAAISKITANGTVTSPVVRGTWVLKRLLGQPPFPPPPVPAIEPDTRGATTVRELLDKHRSSDTCNSCHQRLDPPGFAMEEFDVIGGQRTAYRSLEKGTAPPYKLHGQHIWQYKLAQPVDAKGRLPDGREFNGMKEFKQLLLRDAALVAQAIAGKLTTYGTGAVPTIADRPALREIARKAESKGNGLRTLLLEVVESELFRRR